jgi:hypothetical protein
LIGAAAVAVAIAMLAASSPAQAFKVKTNRGGVCTLTPFTAVQGENQVTYGLNAPDCTARNGIRRIASEGFAIEGSQIVSVLPRKFGQAPYTNSKTSNRTLPPELPTGPVPVPVPPPPPLPDLPINIPTLPELPVLGGNDPEGSSRTYTRIDYSVQLGPNKGKRSKRKPERWRKTKRCKRVSTQSNSDTLLCKAFAVTS